MFITAFGCPIYSAATNAEPVKSNVQLTDKQVKELAALHKDILNKKKELISKYVDYGVLSEEKGKKIISRMEQRYKKLEQNGFILKREKPKTSQ